jgi:hypothetical protein
VSEGDTLEAARSQPIDVAELDQSLGERVSAAQQRMRRAILIGKLQDDPLADLVEAMAQALGVQHEIHRTSVLQYRQASAHLEQQLRAALREARQPLDPAALVRLEQAAATGADWRAAQLARAHNRRTVLTALVTVVAALLVTGAGSYWWGHSAQTATIASTEAGVSAAFRDGPAAAASWLTLMRANDGNIVQGACAASAVKTADGRRACAVGLWIDLPANPPPRTEPVGK